MKFRILKLMIFAFALNLFSINITAEVTSSDIFDNPLNAGYNFSCEYNLKFTNNGQTYKFMFFYYDNSVSVMHNLNIIKSGQTLSSNGIDDSNIYLYLNEDEFLKNFNENDFKCPNIFVSNSDATIYSLYPYTSMSAETMTTPVNYEATINSKLSEEKKQELSLKKGKIEICKERIYLAPGAILVGKKKTKSDPDFLLSNQLSFTMQFDKKNNKKYIVLYYGDEISQPLLYDGINDIDFALNAFDAKHDIIVKFLSIDKWGENFECPTVSSSFNCRYLRREQNKTTLVFTKNPTDEICEFEDQTAQSTDKDGATSLWNDLYDLIDSNISTKPSSCEQLLGGRNSNLIKYLQSAWTIVKIAAIIITIIMAIIDFMTVITKEKDELKECLNKNIKRLIIVIIILLIPTIIDFIGSTIFNSNNILCGIK